MPYFFIFIKYFRLWALYLVLKHADMTCVNMHIFFYILSAAFRCVQRAMTQVLHWAASSKAVPTSTTTGVLWSQVSAAVCPVSPHHKETKGIHLFFACLQAECTQLISNCFVVKPNLFWLVYTHAVILDSKLFV